MKSEKGKEKFVKMLFFAHICIKVLANILALIKTNLIGIDDTFSAAYRVTIRD